MTVIFVVHLHGLVTMVIVIVTAICMHPLVCSVTHLPTVPNISRHGVKQKVADIEKRLTLK